MDTMLNLQLALIDKYADEKQIADSAECEYAVLSVFKNGFETTGGIVFRTLEKAEVERNKEAARGCILEARIITNPKYKK